MLKLGINGFGRIGRNIVRALYETQRADKIKIVAINEIAPVQSMAHLLQYDSTHGRFAFPVEHAIADAGDMLVVGNDSIAVTHHSQPSDLNWRAAGVDIVLECTGVYNSREQIAQHLQAGANKVLLSQPGPADVDNTIIYGINQHTLEANQRIVSAGSCTTNCIVPVIQTLDAAFTVESGTVTTIHSSMHDQQVIDAYHPDLRRTRAASQSIIPVDTKLARGIERILPKFAGKFEAIAVRVPTINVTAMDLSVTVQASADINSVNNAIACSSRGRLAGILDYTTQPLVSVDFNHDPHSCIVDSTQTRVSHKHLIKTLVWCDNEWGFANRMLDTATAMAS